MKGSIDPWLLWSRALILGLLTAGLGTAGHVAAAGVLPGVGTLSTLAVVMVGLSGLLLVRPASGTRLVLALAIGQILVHVVLTAASGHGGGVAMSGHAAHMQASGSGAPAPGLGTDMLLAHVTGHAPMMLAHVAAAALVGWWLARGESALWTLIALAARRVLTTLPALAVVDPLPRQLTTPAPRPAGPLSPWQSRPRMRRGPPVAAVS